MSKIKVLAVSPGKEGVGKFRILDPYIFMGDNYKEEVHVDISFGVEDGDDFFKNYDVVIFHSYIHKSSHENNVKRVKWLKERGIKVVIDIDDYWHVDSRHPMFKSFNIQKIGQKRSELLKLADYVTTTTSIFADTIKNNLGLKNVFIFPNAVNPEEPQFQSKKIESDKVRFGWLGGSSHFHDIELLQSGIKGILSQYSVKSQFVLCGFDIRGNKKIMDTKTGEVKTVPIEPKESIWCEYENFFTNNYKHISVEYQNFLLSFDKTTYPDFNQSYVRRWTEDINKYASNYNYFDVSLSPLVESTFNGNKSQLKVIEAGFHKKAIIASDVNPYTLDLVSSFKDGQFNNNGNSLLVSPKRNHKDWEKHMKRLILNPNLIEDMGNRLYETVKDDYSLQTVTKNRVQFINSIINN
jgi:glycosyltransferase involved in cell wall biosynthesis